jgi:endonuclease-3
MPTTMNKQQLLETAFKILKKHYRAPADAEERPVLEHLLYAIIREGSTREKADKAFKNLRTQFFDWNEVRVSSPHELEAALAGIPGAGERAQRMIGVLQYWFELYYHFNMEDLAKKGLKDAARQLARMLNEVAKGGMKEAGRVPARVLDGNDFAIASVIQLGLGGHAVPLDAPALRVLRRLGLADAEADGLEATRATIEHNVPKAKGLLLSELLAVHAAERCTEERPKCSSCPLLADCPTGQENIARVPEPKPRKSR